MVRQLRGNSLLRAADLVTWLEARATGTLSPVKVHRGAMSSKNGCWYEMMARIWELEAFWKRLSFWSE